MRKLLSITLALMLVLTAFTVAHADADISGDVNFWCSYNEANETDPGTLWMQDNIRLFQEKYPNVNLIISNTPNGDEYLTKITTQMAAGNAPDVFRTWLTGRLKPFVDGGRVAPLNDFLDARPELKATINPLTFSFSQFGDENFYALPIIKSGETVFYNKQIFADLGIEVPNSYAEFMAICEKLNAEGIVPVSMGGSDVWPAAIPYMMLFNRMHGNDLYDEVIIGQQAKFDDPAFAQTGAIIAEMVEANVFQPNCTAIGYLEAQSMFTGGKAAMTFDGLWAVAPFNEKMGDDLGFFNFPVFEDGKGLQSDWIINFDEGYGLSANPSNPEAAEALLAFLVSPERMAAYAEAGQMVASINLDVDTSKVPAIVTEISTSMDVATSAIIPYDNPLGTTVGTEFNRAVQNIMAGEDPEAAFQNLNYYAQDEWQ